MLRLFILIFKNESPSFCINLCLCFQLLRIYSSEIHCIYLVKLFSRGFASHCTFSWIEHYYFEKFDVSDLCDPVEYTLNSQPSSQMASLLSEQFEYMLSQLGDGLLKDLIILDMLGQEKGLKRHFQTRNNWASLCLLIELLGSSD